MRSASATGSGPRSEALGQRLALDELHDEVVGADVIERADVWVVERGHGAGLALEPFAERLGREP